MEIAKNTLECITRHWIRPCIGSGVVSIYILQSGSLWHPLSSSMIKQSFSLVISKLMSVFSISLYNLVEPTIISTNTSSKNNPRSLRGVTILSSLLNFSVFTRSTTSISPVSHFIPKTGGWHSWDNIYYGLSYLFRESLVFPQLQLAYLYYLELSLTV